MSETTEQDDRRRPGGDRRQPRRRPPTGRLAASLQRTRPRRDGGMVPSILGMTGALARLRDEVTIVTPTPSRLDPHASPPGCRL